MASFRLQQSASWRLDEIYQYTAKHWGREQADRYILGLFNTFAKIGSHQVVSRPVPADFGVDGFFCRYERHVIYWRQLSDGDIGIVTILHERMHQIERFQEDFDV